MLPQKGQNPALPKWHEKLFFAMNLSRLKVSRPLRDYNKKIMTSRTFLSSFQNLTIIDKAINNMYFLWFRSIK